MKLLKTLWEYILRLFGVARSQSTTEQWQTNQGYKDRYEETKEMNFTAIFANKLTTLSVSESTGDVVGDNARVAFLDGCLDAVWHKLKPITSRMLGVGGAVVVPYVQGGQIYFDVLSQERMIIHQKQGETITHATLLADSMKQGTRMVFRWVDYRVEADVLYITNKVTDESGKEYYVEQWSHLEDRAIQGVDRVLFAYFKSPVDGRGFRADYGVPITYGCDSIINDIMECFGQIRDEFKLKEVKLFADERMFQRNPQTGKYTMPSKMFFATRGIENKSMIEIFSPDIRDSSYYNRLMGLFDLLEKTVGTSKGILTAPESRGATATEIKAGLYDTYSMVCDIRSVLEQGISDYIYACNVLANYYGLTPIGQYGLVYDWSYSLIESSAETWLQLKEAQAMGIKSKAELRQWLNPNETADEAQGAVEEIRKTEPTPTAVEFAQQKALVDSGYMPPELLLSWYLGISKEEAVKLMPAQEGGLDFGGDD